MNFSGYIEYDDYDSAGNFHAIFANSSVRVNDGGWHHVTASRSGKNYSLTVDGTTATTTASTTLNINTTDSLYFGPPSWFGNWNFQQAVDEIKFGNSNLNWVASQRQAPRRFTNIVEASNSTHWGGPSSLLLDTTNNSAAYMVFNTYEANLAPNLQCGIGTLRFWFQPTWNSGEVAAPNYGLLVNVGTNAVSNGWWALVLTNNGTAIALNTQTNNGSTTLSAQNLLFTNLNFYSTNWYQIAVTFDTNSTALFTNGVLAGTGSGISYYPSLNERMSGGFSIGSDLSGYNQARGSFDELDIQNFVRDTNWIYTNYQAVLNQ
jgi:hypothetical protein